MENLKPARILMVDDEPVVRQIVERALSPTYEVLTLPSSEQLDEALKPFHPDLIILDAHMPGENGWALCGRLRREKRYDMLPIVFLTGLSDEISVRKGYASGGDFHLSKPFTIEELKRMVDIFLGRKHRHPDEYISI